MDTGLLTILLEWVTAHPGSAGLVVALIAFSESLVVVGLVMPGAVLLFGVGALTATGALPLGSTLLWAAAGALAGDWLSFFIGRRFEQPLRRLWPFSKHPELIERGLRFIDRHGGKSLFLGRFVGPVRPILPAVAGMLRMRVSRFLLISACASLLWAPVYLLPGALFGASLGLAAEVGGRLVMAILILVALIWLSVVVVRRVYRLLQPHAVEYLNRAALWSVRHPLLGRVTRGLIDPARPDAGTLAAWALLLLVAVWGFAGMLGSALQSQPPTNLDRALYDLLLGLRTPWIDVLMVRLTHLGDLPVVSLLALVVTLWLTARRRWSACAHWLGAVTFALAVPWLLKIAVGIPRPEAIIAQFADSAFPSGHATRAITLFGFLAVLTARDFKLAWRWLPYTIAVLLALGIAASRLYLGAHWLSDVLGGLTLGLIWVTVLGIAFRLHDSIAGRGRQLSALALGTLLVWGTFYSNQFLERDLERYAVHRAEHDLTITAWLTGGWRQLPRLRHDLRLRRNHPLTVQWAGDPAPLAEQLARSGWQRARPLAWSDSLLWLGTADSGARPILPQIHDGQHEAITLWHRSHVANERLVLRLWAIPYRLQPGGIPLYVGNVSRLGKITVLPSITLPRTRDDFDTPLTELKAQLGPLLLSDVRRTTAHNQTNPWSGRVLLIGNIPLAPATPEQPGPPPSS